MGKTARAWQLRRTSHCQWAFLEETSGGEMQPMVGRLLGETREREEGRGRETARERDG